MSAPPRESKQEGERVYAPLAQHLSQLLGKSVVYQHPQSWREYEKKMKNDEYDIVFDGPHFAAWRIRHLGAKPLVKLSGSLQFVLLTAQDDERIKTPDDLFGQMICTLPAPNLGALTLFAMFPNPARQPKYKIIDGGFKEAAVAFMKGECRGLIIRSAFYRKSSNEELRNRTRILRRSVALTNQGITSSTRITSAERDKIIHSLTKGETSTLPILQRFQSKTASFEPAQTLDYEDHNLLQDNSIFGW
ncbi:MAG: phosphate/phosphite/phosphonate ABC transporter substrate-binding protein [Gammaproteobacteria bacterium]|nr:phosphate/phosphite/phosphonate ABC transporter substrate-binding protein [Gammaproteobacteria bacterium]MDH5801108.1 phosphate/phosphite/phosphonate ABC transporter substrate-binding protein [Gammaproteobacteria bacterium]